MSKITLEGVQSSSENCDRVEYMKAYLDKIVAKENHIDGIRQRNITIALAIFAGLFGFRLQSSGTINTFFVSFSLTALMLVCCVFDRRLHKFTHGWRETRKTLVQDLADAINNFQRDISFQTYCSKAEKQAEWWSLQPVIYYLIALGGILSFFVKR